MSDSSNTSDMTISVERKKTLTLKRNVEHGTVRQSFSHGRSKSVVVEKKKRRIVMPGGAEAVEKSDLEVETPVKAAPVPEVKTSEEDVRELTDSERDARSQALKEAKSREVEDQKQAAEDENRRVEEEEKLRQEREEEEERQRLEVEATEAEARAAEQVARVEKSAQRPVRADKPISMPENSSKPGPSQANTDRETEEASRAAKKLKLGDTKTAKRSEGRRRNKLTITSALTDGDGEQGRGRSLAAIKRRREKEKRASMQNAPREKVSREVVIPESITIQELANRMAERSVELIKILMKQDQMLKINDVIDADTAQLLAEELGHTVRRVAESDVEEGLSGGDDDDKELSQRSPVVTIMGHVDHGKTSLLDAFRDANVVAGEAGGITQHIGAYQVNHEGQNITFLDTPGHAAFTAMRARGAKATDIVILVVAANDGVMPQTIEAINHAKAADVPVIVAINKIDLPDTDLNKVRNELLQHDIFVEGLGGEVLEVEISALKRTNLDKLLEAILLQAELLELKANPNRDGEGTIIEARLDRGRGPVVTALIQRGTLGVGDIFIAGTEWGRVRALIDDHDRQVKTAGPSMPVEVLGLQATPEAGDHFIVVENEARAREIAEYRQRLRRDQMQVRGARGSLEQMMSQLKEAGRSEFPLVVKGDVQGSVEAIIGALESLGTDEVVTRVVHAGVGGITESDVTLAEASKTTIMGFNVRANAQARDAAKRSGCEIRYYSVIYDLVDDVKAAMSGLLTPERRETFLGNAEILEVFNISKTGKVAGCLVTEGMVERGAHVRLIRDDVVIHEGTLSTLKRFKDEVKEVPGGQECGMAFQDNQDMRPKDVIECFRVEEVVRSL